jgi:hypothetical protein
LSDDLRIAIFTTASFLAVPYAFNYDMTSVTAALAGLLAFHSAQRLRSGELLAIVAIWTLPMGVLVFNYAGLPIGPIVLAAMLGYLVVRSGDLAHSLVPRWLPARRGPA